MEPSCTSLSLPRFASIRQAWLRGFLKEGAVEQASVVHTAVRDLISPRVVCCAHVEIDLD